MKMDEANTRRETPQETSDKVAETFFGVSPDTASRQRAIRRFIRGAVESAVLIPLVFYIAFGEVGGLGWGTTIFSIVLCLLAAIGLYYRSRTEYHTKVKLRGDLADRVGAFWLVSCAFGPFLGWVITSTFPITLASWHWLYGLRIFLAAGLPFITALPLTRYVRGKAALVALPLLVIVTILPMLSVVNVSRDLWEGPIVRQVLSTGHSELYLRHTEENLGIVK